MDEDGNFTFTKPEPKEPQEGGSAEGSDKVELDPYAGTNIDASQLGQMQEQAFSKNPQQNPPATRNKPSMETGPDKTYAYQQKPEIRIQEQKGGWLIPYGQYGPFNWPYYRSKWNTILNISR